MNEEKALVKQIIKGDKNRFGDLVESYQRMVAHIVYTNVRNQNDRDDLVQEIFLKIYVNLSTFKFRSKLSTWIGKIAYNSCLNYFNKKRIDMNENLSEPGENEKATRVVGEIQSHEHGPEWYLHKTELGTMLEKKILDLPAKYQTVITLFHIDGLRYHEIAEILGLSMNNTKIMLFRARKTLREKILEEYNQEDLCL